MMWRRIPERYNMRGRKCENCGRHFFPPRAICPDCRRKSKMTEAYMSGRGKVFSFTTVKVAPDSFESMGNYVLGIIQLEEGPKVTAQIVDIDPADVTIGMPVKAEFRKVAEDNEDGIISYGFKFIKA